MNSIVQQQFPVLEQTLALRHQMLDMLSDTDLAFSMANNPSLGALCREMGETERTYIDSFKTFRQPWGEYRHEDATVETSVAALRAWYAELESEMKLVLSALPEEDIQGKMIDRGHGMVFPVMVNFHVYREALLVFYGKASVCLKAMEKPLTEQWRLWIG